MNQTKIQEIKKEFLLGHSLKLNTQDVIYLASLESMETLGFELANLYDTFVNDKDLEYLFLLLSS
jgi:hypothetical protein